MATITDAREGVYSVLYDDGDTAENITKTDLRMCTVKTSSRKRKFNNYEE